MIVTVWLHAGEGFLLATSRDESTSVQTQKRTKVIKMDSQKAKKDYPLAESLLAFSPGSTSDGCHQWPRISLHVFVVGSLLCMADRNLEVQKFRKRANRL